jgi:hypothetical protein
MSEGLRIGYQVMEGKTRSSRYGKEKTFAVSFFILSQSHENIGLSGLRLISFHFVPLNFEFHFQLHIQDLL